ncbi:MAG TPA: PAS domain S-box protein, partial [Gemmatimonadales bacterium]|nr:PAS domain S-box protein [Gemmatimonadales bacterium]
ARSHLDWLAATYDSVPHATFLVDRDGVVLYSTGSAREALQRLVPPGADWSEAAMGTNGAGTALVTGRPVTVTGSEHFLTALHGFTCTGAPIRGTNGELLGVVDVSTPVAASLGAVERLRLVAHTAYAIEQELHHRDWLRHASGELLAERRLADEREGRLAALEALQVSESRFRGAFDHAAIGMAITAPDGRWLRVNRALCEIFGLPEEKLVGCSFQSFTHPDDVAANDELLRRALAGEIDRYRMEKRFIPTPGRVVWAALNAVLVRDPAGTPLYFVAQMADITERKNAEAALRESEARYQRVASNVPGVVYQFVFRPDGTSGYTFVSEGARALFDVSPEEALADPRALLDLIHPADYAEFRGLALAAAADLGPFRWEGRVRLRSGEIRYIQIAARAHRQPDGTIISDGLVMDVTELHLASERLEESEQRYRSLFDHHPDAVVWIDLDGRFVSANPAAEVISGYAPAELVGSSFVPLIVPEHLHLTVARFREVVQGTAQSYESTIIHKSGRRVDIAVTSLPIVVGDAVVGVFGIVKDLTPQRSLEAQLRQAQKMEAIGQLAGGIAHDFNNLLAAIHSNAELALSQLGDHPVREDVETIRNAAERAATLTRQLLAFSRKQVVQPRLLDLNSVVRDTERMLRRILGDGVKVQVELTHPLSSVLADRGQLDQVLLNLAVNARDAMPAGGSLTLRTGHVTVDEALAKDNRGLRPGEYVTLEVEDDGIGMSPELQTRIFEPFFTTKALGQGTGLGLATVYGIMKQYGGYTAVRSAVGRGTTFTLYLPRQEGAVPADIPAATRPLPTGTETVLVVDDEASVRTSIGRILKRHGYTVIEARHGAEALDIIAERGAATIDLVITDLVMPELGGWELMAELKHYDNAPRVLVISGYDEQAAGRGEALPAGTALIEKPFTMEALLHGVRSVLDGA